jgi:hypothetical protein
MAYIIETPNPFEPLTDVRKHIVRGGISILEWLEQSRPGFTEFEVPTICVVNGKPRLRKDWEQKIRDEDIINFITLPQGEFLVIAAIIIIVAVLAVALITTVGAPLTPGEAPASDPVFSTKGQSNAIRLGEPIEVCYGRNRIYPSLAMRPFFQYIDNDQFQHSLFCLGQGEYEIDTIQIGDTEISSYQEVEWEVIPPGSPVTLIPTNVSTSVEAGGQTLLASNDEEYVAPGWVGPFPSNPPATETSRIQLDIIFPKGLYLVTEDGHLDGKIVELEIQARLINDVGAPLGAYFDLPFPSPYYITAATTTPQRRTLNFEVAAGRYEVRVRRIDIKDLSSRAGHEVVLEGMRAYIDVEPDFGDVTLLAVSIRATNNLNNKTAQLFNVIATRKLPVRDTNGFGSPVATRSIIWAFVDVLRSIYGGRIFDEVFFDWDGLEALDAIYEGRDEHFDWIFRDPVTVWEAARSVARVGRATPLLIGSLITMKREAPSEIPVTLFTPENITKGSFSRMVKLWDLDEFDSIKIEYTEPATGYKQEHVTCTLPGGTSNNSQDVRLPGCQDRTHAYHEGMFMLAQLRYLRENVTIETGLEGHIPTFGDLIAISHDVPRWGQSGYIVNAVRQTGDDYLLYLSEPLNWDLDTGEHQIVLRGKQAEYVGPFTAVRLDDPSQVAISIVDTSDFDFLLSGRTEPMLFIFGVAGAITKYMKVVKIEPQGGEAIRISTVNDAPIIHTFDDLEPAPLEIPPLPPVAPDLPIIAHLYVTQINDNLDELVQIAWTGAFGAQYYTVQTSEDGVNWQERARTTQTSVQLQVRPGDLYVRVAGVNNGQGPWISNFESGSIPIVIVTPEENLTNIYNQQAGLRVMGQTAVDYGIVEELDTALAAIINGTVTELQGALAAPTDKALGELIET